MFGKFITEEWGIVGSWLVHTQLCIVQNMRKNRALGTPAKIGI